MKKLDTLGLLIMDQIGVNMEDFKMWCSLAAVIFTIIVLLSEKSKPIQDLWHVLFICLIFTLLLGSHIGISVVKQEPVQCVASSLPTVHGEKLNKIDLTLKCGEDTIQITDQQIGYSFSESGVKRSGKPSPQTIINE